MQLYIVEDVVITNYRVVCGALLYIVPPSVLLIIDICLSLTRGLTRPFLGLSKENSAEITTAQIMSPTDFDRSPQCCYYYTSEHAGQISPTTR